MLIFDAHLDLACLAVNGRDMLVPLDQLSEGGPHKAGPWPPAGVTLPSLSAGNVRIALATIFTEAGGDGPEGYPIGDLERAAKVGRAQLEVYRTWQDDGHIAIDLPQLLHTDPHIGEIRGGMGVSEVQPPSIERRLERGKQADKLHIGILIENAEPIASLDELEWWKQQGVVAVGMAWSKPSRFAAGNACHGDDDFGISDKGRDFVAAMDDLNLVHDISHLSQRASDQLFELTDRPVIASHSNCRALVGGRQNPYWQRHVSDETIAEVGRRGGVIGLNLCRNFITLHEKQDPRPTIAQAVDHVEKISTIMGRRDGVGFGTDMDGGFSAKNMLEGVERPSDLSGVLNELTARGWSHDEVAGFAHNNWVRFFSTALHREQTSA